MHDAHISPDSPLLIALRLQYDYMYISNYGTQKYGTHMDAFALLLPANADHADVVQIFAAELQGPGDPPVNTSFDERWRLDGIEGRQALALSFRMKPLAMNTAPSIISQADAENHVNELALHAAESCAFSAGALGMIRARDMQEPHTLSIGLSRAFERLIALHEERLLCQATTKPTARPARPQRKGL